MKLKSLKTKVVIAAALMVIAPLAYFNSYEASALSILARSADLTSNEPGVVADYDIDMRIQQLVLIGSIEIEFCSNNPIPGDPCTPPVGFDATGTNLISQSGETGFSVDGASTATRVILTRAPAVATQANLSYTLDDITNPTAAQSTYYVRLSTYASNDATGPIIDDGGIALSTSDQFDLSLYVPPYLSFCKGIEITGLNCATAVGAQLNFGVLSENETKYDSSEFVVTTNAVSGYNVVVNGPTMTSGNNTINNVSSPNFSSVGAEQFGFNLRDNGSPDVGTNPTGLVTGGPTFNYNQTDRYTFNNGDTVARSTTPDASSYTVSYIVNVPANQPPGVYTTTLTFVAFASF